MLIGKYNIFKKINIEKYIMIIRIIQMGMLLKVKFISK